MSGKLKMELMRTEGDMVDDEDEASTTGGSDIFSDSTTSELLTSGDQEKIRFRLKIKSAEGLPHALAHFVFCQFSFNEENPVVIASSASRQSSDEFIFDFSNEYVINVTEKLKERCRGGAVSVEVFGQKSKGFFSLHEAIRDKKRAQTGKYSLLIGQHIVILISDWLTHIDTNL